MSTSPDSLKYLWTGYFLDGKILEQPRDDKYSKHDDDAEHNPSAFRDLLDYMETSDLIYFDINDGTFAYGVDLPTGRFGINGTWFSIEEQYEPLTDRKLVYYRAMKQDTHLKLRKEEDGTITDESHTDAPVIESYYFGYEGKNANGKLVTKVIRID